MALSVVGLGLPEQAMGWFPLGLVVEDRPTEFSCIFQGDVCMLSLINM